MRCSLLESTLLGDLLELPTWLIMNYFICKKGDVFGEQHQNNPNNLAAKKGNTGVLNIAT